MLVAVAEDARHLADLPRQLLRDDNMAHAQRQRAGRHHRGAGRACGPKALMEMYRMATADQHGVLYVNLLSERNQLFYNGFDQRVVLSE